MTAGGNKMRHPAVAGHFYPAGAAALEKELRRLVRPDAKRRRVLGLMAPHAGYVYSGGCAGQGYARVEITPAVILLGVNHRGLGAQLAVDGHDAWETPLGSVEVDAGLRARLLASSRSFREDSEAGRLEHSLEVQVPFIQHAAPAARILPVTVAAQRLDELLAAGEELATLVAGDVGAMMVASSDMSHYIPAERARELDMLALERMLQLDAEGLYRVVRDRRISMCGVAPAVIMLQAARQAGASGAELVCYTHSGEVSGDHQEVVGYASLIVY
ncbi:MAG TPA: AmmeMemoRadiSam system protein B [Candidatus Aminicenantes bacterium]|nr:AmmeMemoRadiSam system protein B [Candidatus Aminicenantes bacterium]